MQHWPSDKFCYCCVARLSLIVTPYHIAICTPIHQIIYPFRSQILYVCIKKEYKVCFTLNRFSKSCFHSDSFCRKRFSVLLNHCAAGLTS